MSATSAPMLPGIRDLFPDHLFDAAQVEASHTKSVYAVPASSASITARRHSIVQNPYPREIHSSAIHRRSSVSSQYSVSSAEAHIPSSSPPTSFKGIPTNQAPSRRGSTASRSRKLSSADSVSSIDGAPKTRGKDDHDDPTKDGKRHTCPHCGKRFNRPSSLGIHVNTHTGAKPFECPFPGCGRQFNVSSNMRRHYRNHSSSSSSNTIVEVGYPSSANTSPSITATRPSTGYSYTHSRSNSGSSFIGSPSISELSLSSDGDDHELDEVHGNGWRSRAPHSDARSERHIALRGAAQLSSSYGNGRNVYQGSSQAAYAFPPPQLPTSMVRTAPAPMMVQSGAGVGGSGHW